MSEKTTEKTGNISNTFAILSVMLIAAVALLAFNFFQQGQINEQIEKQSALIALSGGSTTGGAQSSNTGTASFSDVTPKGVPGIYGQELGVSYDDVSTQNPQKADATIAKLAAYDEENSSSRITLSGDKLQRYIKIASQISCEYCCGAQSIITADGKAACGCAHSYSMRGLAKYLLTNHADEFTDDQILEELGKWKTLFFPSILAQKAAVMQQQGIEFNYINLASNKYRGLEKGASSSGGSMVGGC